MTASTTNLPSLNEANERDPYNNNSYGTLVDSDYKLVTLPILDVRAIPLRCALSRWN